MNYLNRINGGRGCFEDNLLSYLSILGVIFPETAKSPPLTSKINKSTGFRGIARSTTNIWNTELCSNS